MIESKLKSPIGETLYLPFRISKNGCPVRSFYKKDNVKYCSWCGENSVIYPSKKYCSKQCKTSAWWLGRLNNLKILIKLRDKVCVICGFKKPTPLYNGNINWNILTDNGFDCWRSLYEIDHILPKCEGGSHMDENNLRLLCQLCHKTETRKLKERLKKERKRKSIIKRKYKKRKKKEKFIVVIKNNSQLTKTKLAVNFTK